MKQLYPYIFSLLALVGPAFTSLAQQIDSLDQVGIAEGIDSLVQKIDSTFQDTLQIQTQISMDSTSDQHPPVDEGFIKFGDIYLDYGKLASIPFGMELKAEMGAGIYMRNNFGINVEAGYGAKYPEDHYKNAEYSSYGYYGRIGINYLLTYAPGVHLYFGGKYGYSLYEDEGTYELGSDFWGDSEGSFHRTDLQADWFEVIMGSERRWKGNIYLGFQARVRAIRNFDNFTPIEVYSIPGYGRTMDKAIPALNLYIKYMIGNRIEEEEE